MKNASTYIVMVSKDPVPREGDPAPTFKQTGSPTDREGAVKMVKRQWNMGRMARMVPIAVAAEKSA